MRRPSKIIFEYEGAEAAALYDQLTSTQSPLTAFEPQIKAQSPEAVKVSKARAPKTLTPSATAEVTLSTITKQFVALANAKGHQKALEILQQFDAPSVPKLKLEQFAEVAAALEHALGTQ